MELKPYKRINVSDYELSRIQGFVKDYTDQLSPLIFLSGNLITVDVTTSPQSFNHYLGVEPRGWLLFDKTTNANVWRSSWSDQTITLVASANSSIKVWVF